MVDVYFDWSVSLGVVGFLIMPFVTSLLRIPVQVIFSLRSAASLLGLWDPGFFLYFSLEIEFLTFGLIFIELHLQG
ncbi:hypothetical protein V6N11_036964 [Hibiscus sabdariffa]|uniref:Uncharacterized protein n=1 Tax=Hibiscus sabdariffa TaxID=183260 RepID=A0ABR2RBW6_9ROSI